MPPSLNLPKAGTVCVYVVRHGRTTLNKDGKFRGNANPPLDEVGIKQAETLAELFEPIDLSHIFCYASVDESVIGDVQVGQPAEITADSFPRKRFKGEVVRIATTGVNLQNVITFQVRIEITSENKTLLKPQMSTNVVIIIADKPDVLQIPANAVIHKKGGDFVRVKSNAPEGEERPIEIGISDNRNTEVISGLKEGDEVIEQNPADETRWAAGGQSPAQSKARQQMMMMRMGGAGGPRR